VGAEEECREDTQNDQGGGGEDAADSGGEEVKHEDS
jgi:hypothetical protein